MWIKSSQELGNGLFFINTGLSSHLVASGHSSAIIDTGISANATLLEEQVAKLVPVPNSFHFILLTHAHFDHVGALPNLRRQHPGAVVACSPQTAELLSNRDYLVEIYQKNCLAAADFSLTLELSLDEWICSFEIDRIMGDGDVLSLGGGVEIRSIAVPGHSDDSVAYYISPGLALAAGESCGAYGGRNRVWPTFSANYSKYLASLEDISKLDIRYLCLAHQGVLSGDLVQRFLSQLRQETVAFNEVIKKRLDNEEGSEQIFRELLEDWRSGAVAPDGPFTFSQEEILKGMIDAVCSVPRSL